MPRALEVLLAALLLVLLLPVLLLAGLAVRLTSAGPALYRQQRVGRDGALFSLWKLRTMHVGAESAGLLTVGDDRRVTPVGRVLRAHRVDELPQLVNVVRGDMSLVGPRPEVPGFLVEPPRRRPGLTDPASLAFRDEAGLLARQPDPERYYREVLLPEKVRLSAAYAASRTTWTDVRVLVRTARVLVSAGRPSR